MTIGLGKLTRKIGTQLVMLTAALLIAACSSSDSEDSGGSPPPPGPPPPPPPPPPAAAPVANAGPDRTVQEQTVVNLAGSATDVNGDPITYLWVQTAGVMVTLNNANTAGASFDAPDVQLGNPQTLSFELTASDPGGLSTTDTVNITVQETAVPVTISGVLQYEFPPPNAQCRGLNFSSVEVRPIRQATVQLLDGDGRTLLDSTVSDDLGRYSLTADPSTDVMVRVRAEMLRSGALTWDVQVRNNVDTGGSPPPLDQRPIYAMDSVPFNSGTSDLTRDLLAETGWGGSSYTSDRVAAPFSILDAIYKAMLFIASEDPSATFPALDAFWSPDNRSVAGESDIDAGELPTSFYNGQSQLFLLGRDGDDTEEFDDHVITHEWSHYFEDNFSRSDSIGGAHFIGRDLLDMRVAFGEGFADAMSAMTLNDPIYCDTSWFGGSQSGFSVNMESSNTNNEGWYDEVSVFEIIYDLWDTNNDGADNDSIGFGPIYSVMTGPQSSTPAFTSIFTFATYLKQQGTGKNAFIDALLTEHDIVASGIDLYGASEANDGPGTPSDVLPIYTDITLGSTTNICVNSQFDDSNRDGNKLSEHRYLRLNLSNPRVVTFTMTTASADGNSPSQPTPGFDCMADPDDPENSEHSDPDFLVWQNGDFRGFGFSCEPNSEVSSMTLNSGFSVIDINEYRHEDIESPANYPERVCFDFMAN
jgi:hypothetical protein